MQDHGTRQYYHDRGEAYWRGARRLFVTSERILALPLGSAEAAIVTQETKEAFDLMVQELPDIGGERNMFTPTLIGSALALAYLQTLERRGFGLEEAGKTLYEVYYGTFAPLPSLVRWVLRQREFSSRHMERLRLNAAMSQRKEYPFNWVLIHVEGNGKDLDFGNDYLECAVLKFLHARGRGEEKYVPYLCMLDLAYSRAIGSGLMRTGTLYWGAPCCDFRYFKGREAPSTTSFLDLPEYRDRKTR